MFPSSSNSRHSVGRTRRRGSASPPSNPYDELYRWDCEDLIQLDSPKLKPDDVAFKTKARTQGLEEDRGMSEESGRDVSSPREQFSLIDLDDQNLGRAEEKLTENSTSPLHAERKAKNQSFLNETSTTSKSTEPEDFVSPGPGSQGLTHKSNRLAPGAVPHEKTDHNIAKTIQKVLGVKTTDEEQAILHENDQDTTWFGIVREDGELPTFVDYGRYATLMTNTSRSERSRGIVVGRDTRYPSLVSFVGQTGAGKSTIIKLVIDLGARKEENFATPVVGPIGKDIPTSGDVHLYLDPQTANSDTPIMCADCEGLEGGEREPLGAWRKARDRSGRTRSFERKLGNNNNGSEREITWATSNLKKSRGFAVTHLYPRLLYTFSDVIVFVLRNPRVVESVFENLVNWAAAALETSSNQPNPVFQKYAQFWRERTRSIETAEDLLLSYYSSITVVRIPTSGRPNLINDQIKKLYATIQENCSSARRQKGELRMLLDAEELQPYLQFAFDHFARYLETPFDFVQASFTNSPIPLNFGGNILKLAINMMEVWENEADGRTLFVELSYMVASCIMLDSARHKLRGTAKQIFPHYIEHIDAALENFCDRHWPCEYVQSGGGGRCVNVRSGHGSKGHQRKNGKVLSAGGYVSSFSFESYRKEFQDEIYFRLYDLLKIRRSRVEEDDQPEAQAAAEIHKDKSWKVLLKPAAAGIRMLTLDGGGIRGIAELETLRQIERAMGGRIPLQCFFDLIVGTSTGGIIALGLVAKKWSIEECTHHFEDLCQKAFTRRTGGNIPGVGWLIENYNHSKYETQPLEEALITAFSSEEYLFGGSRPHESFAADVKVAVTTTSAAGSPVILTNYNRICDEKRLSDWRQN
ncbi:hypothetical protein MMC29_000144 [Sticta canariensis]|nr:hypothetical protein [Sticta canariensis]